MDNNSNWQRPVFRQNLQRQPFGGIQTQPGAVQGNTGAAFSYPNPGSLSREERIEAKRLMEEAQFSFTGYQVVRREFISHKFDPAMTIRSNSITFNSSCISKLEEATYIQFLINPEERKLAIRPCDEGAKDAVRWCVIKGDKRKSREITCRPFTSKLYNLMGWEPVYRYKLQGMKILYEGENIYLFDLRDREAFLPQTRNSKTGKIVRTEAILPAEWGDSFGMGVEEHKAFAQIDLFSGYNTNLDDNGKEILEGVAHEAPGPDEKEAGSSAGGEADSGPENEEDK